ncbi:uncharacterized protein METZ01_LOCUS453430, partial [marine metagenome]
MGDSLTNKKDKLWDGRFSEATDAFVESFTASVEFDHVLALYDIDGSIAHATMLSRIGVLSDIELSEITSGLNHIAEQIKAGNFTWS